MSHHTLPPPCPLEWNVLIWVAEELPALRDGSTTLGGFENIVDYLRKRSDGQWDLDRQLSNPKDKADITAYFIYLPKPQESTANRLAF